MGGRPFRTAKDHSLPESGAPHPHQQSHLVPNIHRGPPSEPHQPESVEDQISLAPWLFGKLVPRVLPTYLPGPWAESTCLLVTPGLSPLGAASASLTSLTPPTRVQGRSPRSSASPPCPLASCLHQRASQGNSTSCFFLTPHLLQRQKVRRVFLTLHCHFQTFPPLQGAVS